MKATVRAHPNIALVKYWGKRDREFNTPAAGSLSLTLAAFTTTTTVEESDTDQLNLDGAVQSGAALARFRSWTDHVRQLTGSTLRFRADTHNDFPTASGLASSASAYAALAVATTACAGVTCDPRELSILARIGSGSAARSIFGGLVVMNAGNRADGQDSYAEPLLSKGELAEGWPLAMVVAIIDDGRPKEISSRDAMQRCQETSPLYAGWISSVSGDLAAARSAIDNRDLDTLGTVTEHSALTMHAAAIASRPTTLYWRPTTLAAIEAVRAARKDGVSAYFTMDAGPHVKVLTTMEQAGEVARRLESIAGINKVVVSEPGGPAQLAAA